MNFAGQYYLAMATPGCIELNQDELICVQRLLEVLLCEHKYSLVLGDFTKGCPKEEKTCQKSHLDLCNKSIVINKVKNLWQSSIFHSCHKEHVCKSKSSRNIDWIQMSQIQGLCQFSSKPTVQRHILRRSEEGGENFSCTHWNIYCSCLLLINIFLCGHCSHYPQF